MGQSPGTAKRKILIVDDSAVVRRNLKKLLLGHPGVHSVIEAHSVYSTIQHVATDRPDVVIVDIQLPDGSGFEVLEYLALQEPRPFTVVLTNFPDKRNEERAAALGANHFFDKSFEYERLLEVLTSQ